MVKATTSCMRLAVSIAIAGFKVKDKTANYLLSDRVYKNDIK